MNKHNFAVFDTETIGLSPKLVYDLGLIICNRAGEPIAQKSWIVREIFTDAKLMLGAFYSHKVFTHYIPALDAGTMRLHSFADIRAEFNAMIAKHSAKTVCAYNIGFDRRAMRETWRHTGNAGNFLAHPVAFADLWLASCRTLINTNRYRAFCREHGFISPAGNFRTSAESVTAYLRQNPTFKESHTALEDCEIETEILAAINKRKQKFPRNVLDTMPWRIVQR